MLRTLNTMYDTQEPAKGPVIADLRTQMKAQGLNALIVPRFDAHQAEYVAPHDERLGYVTGFTGSAGMAIISADEAALFVDGRYTVQAAGQCPEPLFTHYHLFETPPESWLSRVPQAGWRIGFDAMHLPPSWYDRFARACHASGAEMVATEGNLVDQIWADQPAPPKATIQPMPLQFAGVSAVDKLADLCARLAQEDADFFVDTQPDNIAWVLNVRGADVAFNPIPQSFLMVSRAGKVTWFVDPDKLTADLTSHLPESVELRAPGDLLPTVRTQVTAGQRIWLDPDFSAVAVRLAVEAQGAQTLLKGNPLTLTKAVKNRFELEGLRDCHLRDGVAWTEFSAWLAHNVPQRADAGQPISEREAEDKILEFRQAQPGFIYESFNSISAAAGNAAMCHYATLPGNDVPILPTGTYLLDSGGQYDTGTTDATRSFAFSDSRPEGYDRAYTAVFKAFHALVTLRFPKGTQGHHIDAICRRPLWDLGLDYDHGTGHGIGHRLSVHEHPQRIGKPHNPVNLRPGMILSIEPGHYVAELYGIRIENLFEVVEADDGFMEFRNLTWAPIQTDMLDRAALTDQEWAWLSQYHAQVKQHLGAHLSDQASDWLDKACQVFDT
jgi:Xaa-Pro aminopeptidase